jgi:hypothetical protein
MSQQEPQDENPDPNDWRYQFFQSLPPEMQEALVEAGWVPRSWLYEPMRFTTQGWVTLPDFADQGLKTQADIDRINLHLSRALRELFSAWELVHMEEVKMVPPPPPLGKMPKPDLATS